MITGIDETGDFRLDSNEISFFVGIHLDQNLDKLTIKEKQFEEWEVLIPEANRSETGEVKGRLLTDFQLEEFYKNVMIKSPRCHFSVVEFLPTHNSIETLGKHKKWITQQIEEVMEEYKRTNRPRWAKRYNEILGWTKNLSYQEIIKMKCLQHLLAISFNQSFIYSQIAYLHDKDTLNLKELSFRIDKDFVRSPNVRKFWDEHFHQFLKTVPKDLQPLLLSNPKDIINIIGEHFKIENGQLIVTRSFNENTTFVDSKDSFEVRMADIFGTILHRHHNKGLRCASIWNSLLDIIEVGNDIPIYTRLVFKE
jgi:hypothetical protein